MSDHHSSGRLPWELYDLICSHSSRSDQTRLLRVCHQFFEITVPHLWREVSLLPLLLLLESKTRTAASGKDETNPPSSTKPPAKSLVERLRSYGKHVEHFTIHSFETGRADSPEDPYQSILTSAGFSEVMLPRLKSLSLNFATPPNFYRTETWIVVFVPTTIRELTFRAQNPQDTRLVQPLHSRFAGITRFELQLPEMPEATSWKVFDRNQPLPALEEVELECHKLDRPVLRWASRLYNIRTLRLNFHGGSLISSRLFSGSNPYSFPSLESIYIRITESSWHLVEQFWQSPLVSNVTRVALSGSSMVGSSLDLDAELFSALATHSPKLNYLEIHESGQATEDFGIPILLLLILSPLPLRVLRIPRPIARDHGSNILETVSKLWPDIEELLLPGTQVEQQELLELPRYLPRVRHFHFSMLQEWVYDAHILRGILGRHSFCALDSGHCACLRAPDVWCDRAAT